MRWGNHDNLTALYVVDSGWYTPWCLYPDPYNTISLYEEIEGVLCIL